MTNERRRVEETMNACKRFFKYPEAEKYFGMERKTIRRLAKECGAYLEYSATLIRIDGPVLEEYLLSFKR